MIFLYTNNSKTAKMFPFFLSPLKNCFSWLFFPVVRWFFVDIKFFLGAITSNSSSLGVWIFRCLFFHFFYFRRKTVGKKMSNFSTTSSYTTHFLISKIAFEHIIIDRTTPAEHNHLKLEHTNKTFLVFDTKQTKKKTEGTSSSSWEA